MKRLAQLTGEPEEKLSRVVAKLEDLSGFNSEDVRLLSNLGRKVHHKVQGLGLDPKDTTSQELYEALKVKCSNDLALISKAWGITDENMNQKVIEVAAHHLNEQKVLAIKCTVIKRNLKDLPPKKVMKLLKYRSIDSMLKREDTRKLLALAQIAESVQWNSKFSQRLVSLSSADYEMRQMVILDLSNEKLSNMTEYQRPITYTSLMATIVLWPHKISSQLCPALVLSAFRCEEALSAESSFLSSHQFSSDFAKIAQRLFIAFHPVYLNINKQPFITGVDVHLMRARISKNSAYDKFISLHPCLLWWKETRTLAYETENLVSMHLGDVSAGLIGGLKFIDRCFYNLQREIKQDLFKQYSNYANVKHYIEHQFDDTLIALEEFSNSLQSKPVLETSNI